MRHLLKSLLIRKNSGWNWKNTLYCRILFMTEKSTYELFLLGILRSFIIYVPSPSCCNLQLSLPYVYPEFILVKNWTVLQLIRLIKSVQFVRRTTSCKAAVKRENKKPTVQKLLVKPEMIKWNEQATRTRSSWHFFYLADALPSPRLQQLVFFDLGNNREWLLPVGQTRRLRRNKRASLSPNFGRLAIAFYFSSAPAGAGSHFVVLGCAPIHPRRNRILLRFWQSAAAPSPNLGSGAQQEISALVTALRSSYQKRQFRKLHNQSTQAQRKEPPRALWDAEKVKIFLGHYPEERKIFQNEEHKCACFF
jgi:hypothetical protein